MPGSAPASRQLDILALAPLPCRLNGAVAFQRGGSLQCAWLVTGLARLGHRVRVIAVGPLQPSPFEPGEVDGAVAVDWFAVEMLDTASPPPAGEVARRRAQFARALDRSLAEGRPDLVILGNESHSWYAADPCRERGLTTVVTAQGVPTAAIPDGIYPEPALRALAGHLRTAALAVAVSHDLEAILRGLGLSHVETIETGIDTEAFRPRARDPGLMEAYGIPAGRFVVGSFAHMRPEKRVPDLVRGAEVVLRSEPRALFLIAGSGAERDALVELVAERGLEDDFRFVGELDHSRVPACMALCDVVVLASEREGYALVCHEAHASGCALVVSDIPAGRAAARGGSTGLTFALGDAADMAAQILRLARDDELRASIGRAARAAAEENSGDAWLHAWSRVLAATANGAPR